MIIRFECTHQLKIADSYPSIALQLKQNTRSTLTVFQPKLQDQSGHQQMSKAIETFFSNKLTPGNLAKVATTKTFTPGRRVAPVDKREDADAQLRVDAGEKIGDKQNFVLQVNSQAKNTALKKFVAQNGRGTTLNLPSPPLTRKLRILKQKREGLCRR